MNCEMSNTRLGIHPCFALNGVKILYTCNLKLLLYTYELYGPKFNIRTTLLSIFINASVLRIKNHRRVYLFDEFDLI